MSRTRLRKVEDLDLEYAAHPRKPGLLEADTSRAQHVLYMPHPRPEPSGPEPVTVPAMVNGRELASWERGLYVEAMERERRRELALFTGLIS